MEGDRKIVWFEVYAGDKANALYGEGLAYSGNPPGLVDERFVSALRAAYLEKRRPR